MKAGGAYMKNKEFYLDCDGIALHAKMDFPEVEKPVYPMVIVIHGLTGHMEERHIKGLAAACNQAGYATLRVELYGHGKSGGDFKNHTIAHWVLEIMRVIDYAKSLDFVSDLYLTGHSQGGASVVLAAALKEDCLKALIPLAPAMMIKEYALQGGFPGSGPNPENPEEEFLLFGERPLSNNYVKVAKFLPFEEAIKSFKKPVLIVHADTDEMVPFVYSQKLQKEYADARLVNIPGDDHCFDAHLDQVLEAVLKFLEEQK